MAGTAQRLSRDGMRTGGSPPGVAVVAGQCCGAEPMLDRETPWGAVALRGDADSQPRSVDLELMHGIPGVRWPIGRRNWQISHRRAVTTRTGAGISWAMRQPPLRNRHSPRLQRFLLGGRVSPAGPHRQRECGGAFCAPVVTVAAARGGAPGIGAAHVEICRESGVPYPCWDSPLKTATSQAGVHPGLTRGPFRLNA